MQLYSAWYIMYTYMLMYSGLMLLIFIIIYLHLRCVCVNFCRQTEQKHKIDGHHTYITDGGVRCTLFAVVECSIFTMLVGIGTTH